MKLCAAHRSATFGLFSLFALVVWFTTGCIEMSDSPYATFEVDLRESDRELVLTHLRALADENSFKHRLGKPDPEGVHITFIMWNAQTKITFINPFEANEFLLNFYPRWTAQPDLEAVDIFVSGLVGEFGDRIDISDTTTQAE